MHIWLDNDGCPRQVRDVVFNASGKRKLAVVVVANRFTHVPPGGLIKMVVVSGAFDAADDHIAEQVAAGDLVITADVPLAARIVAKGATGLNPRGEVYDASNVQEKLAVRNLMAELRSGANGALGGGQAPLGDGDRKRFADAFDRLVTRLSSQT